MSSNAPRRPVRDLRFFLTVPHACSYLPGKEATTLFLDPRNLPFLAFMIHSHCSVFVAAVAIYTALTAKVAMPVAQYAFLSATSALTAPNANSGVLMLILLHG